MVSMEVIAANRSLELQLRKVQKRQALAQTQFLLHLYLTQGKSAAERQLLHGFCIRLKELEA